MDRQLDQAAFGPTWLKREEIAQVVVDALRYGEPFWQSESYDRWVRNDVEFRRIERYIEENPVRAGLVSAPEEYRWSSAYAGANAGVAGQEARSTGDS
jgi:hypothetical protein